MPAILFVLLVLFPIRSHADEAANTWENDQFRLAIPGGWQAYNQNEALFQKAGPYGVIIFSEKSVVVEGKMTADTSVLAALDRGDIASFFVDRQATEKGTSCQKLSRSAIYNLGVKVSQDPAISAVQKYFTTGMGAKHTNIELGGCKGVRFVIDAGKKGTASHWIIDVRAVSDGQTMYLFALRNHAGHYEKNLEVFNRSMAGLLLLNAR